MFAAGFSQRSPVFLPCLSFRILDISSYEAAYEIALLCYFSDVNECLFEELYSCVDEFHRCVNTLGSYKCECDQGLYFKDGKCIGKRNKINVWKSRNVIHGFPLSHLLTSNQASLRALFSWASEKVMMLTQIRKIHFHSGNLKRYFLFLFLGLEKNESVPIPVISAPRVPSKEEKEESVQISISLTTNQVRVRKIKTIPFRISRPAKVGINRGIERSMVRSNFLLVDFAYLPLRIYVGGKIAEKK